MDDELKPCPFCGGEAKVADWPVGSAGEREAGVTCQSCGATFGESVDFLATPEEIQRVQPGAVKAWNRRAEAAALADAQATIARLEAALRGIAEATDLYEPCGWAVHRARAALSPREGEG